MDIFLLIVIILFIVAAVDIVVGVSNDAVNFLNSAIGSKVASFKTIMAVATVGILVGAFTSSGLMEVARKGVFDPGMFTYEGMMYVFLAVMLTDVILLDLFNEYAMPTSTTVSIVFELFGASTAMALMLIAANQGGSDTVYDFIKIDKALFIMGGIFLSILVAFTFGLIIQFFSRWWLTFSHQKNRGFARPLFAGIAITCITYFLLIKGLKGSPLKGSVFYAYISENILLVLAILLVLWTLMNVIIEKLASINPLKTVVLTGTFSLAMAFAGNDLVNFIGVPIGAYQGWQLEGGSAEASNAILMNSLNQSIKVPWFLLGLSGVLMSLTLWFSSKAKKVTETEINLARQGEGTERFKPNFLAKGIVAIGAGVGNVLQTITPKRIKHSIQQSYITHTESPDIAAEDKPAFDLIRASVNLMMASIIISYATFKKLPLSTTFVSFMVAMGSSLADMAWGRESAGSRVAGVLNVIGGWLLTAVIAFTSAALMAVILFKLKLVGIVIVSLIALFSVLRNNTDIFGRRS